MEKKQIWLPVGGDPLFFGLHKKWLIGYGQGNSLIHIRLKKNNLCLILMKGEGDIYEDDLYLTKSMNLCKSLFGIGIAMNISVVRLTGTLSFIWSKQESSKYGAFQIRTREKLLLDEKVEG